MSLTPQLTALLQAGLVIPAHPLALTDSGSLDEVHQAALTRYYVDAGAGGIAVGVHTTQFAVRKAGMLGPVLRLASEVADDARGDRPLIKAAGVSGPTAQVVREAELAAELGYDVAMPSVDGLADWDDAALLRRTEAVSEVLPVFGFYLQPAVGGRRLSYDYWRRLADNPELVGIKLAPFDRYATLETVRAVCHSERRDGIALYTGNDDNIVADLLTTCRVQVAGTTVEKPIVGGLLGQWAVWTRRAVELLEQIKRARRTGAGVTDLLSLGTQLTDANAAIFDVAHGFAGSIPGVHEVLRRQGLMRSIRCLDPQETLSPGQAAQIGRVLAEHPGLADDDFVRAHLHRWLGGARPATVGTGGRARQRR